MWLPNSEYHASEWEASSIGNAAVLNAGWLSNVNGLGSCVASQEEEASNEIWSMIALFLIDQCLIALFEMVGGN